jgi:hypothetical protein
VARTLNSRGFGCGARALRRGTGRGNGHGTLDGPGRRRSGESAPPEAPWNAKAPATAARCYSQSSLDAQMQAVAEIETAIRHRCAVLAGRALIHKDGSGTGRPPTESSEEGSARNLS